MRPTVVLTDGRGLSNVALDLVEAAESNTVEVEDCA